ncbi:MAG: VWA domain-containing protein [Mucinivorans sp.]
MFRFAEPQYFYLLLLIPLLVVGYVYYRRDQKRREALFAQAALFAELAREASPKRVRTKFILLLVAISLIVTALAQPQLGAKLGKAKGNGSEIMLTVDVSRSMLAEDFAPSRLERTKNAIRRLIEKLDKDRVGMVIFAGAPYIQLPITSDYVSAGAFVSNLSPNLVPEQGTSVASAIELASRSFSEGSERSRTIILITDGESHDDDPLAAALAAKEKGIVIHTVGIGTPQGAPISIDGQMVKDSLGEIVVSKLDEATLQKIAVETGGVYVRATEQSVGLDEILKRIDQMQKQEYETLVFQEYDDQFYYLAILALVALLIESLMISRKNRILSRISIFSKKEE